ncbi:hypothetical protein Tco_1431518 [Tanacetum coccineum]
MNPVATQQVALDNSLVAPEKRLKIEKCNARIAFSKPQKEETYQVTLDALKLSRCYPAFLVTAEVPEGMYNKKNVDYVALLWEDFMYQANNREISSARKEHMPYPRFTKVIISHFICKNKTIFMRNRINLHTIRDDSLLAKKHTKKSNNVPTAGVIIKDTPGVPVSKKKAHSKGDRGKGMELLYDAALLGVAQVIELVPNQRFLMSHKTRQLVQMKESWGDSGDDDNDDDSNEVLVIDVVNEVINEVVNVVVIEMVNEVVNVVVIEMVNEVVNDVVVME